MEELHKCTGTQAAVQDRSEVTPRATACSDFIQNPSVTEGKKLCPRMCMLGKRVKDLSAHAHDVG